MKAKSSAHYQREYRKRLREQGLVKKEVWVLPGNAGQLTALEKQLRLPGEVNLIKGADSMAGNTHTWSTSSLCEALQNTDPFASGQAKVELIDGVEPSLHIVMHEYGDLPIFATVSGEQIIVESMLWPVAEVTEVERFHETILRTHKYFPLSTISLDRLGADGDYYHMFGSLSAASILSSVIFEIEMLASNVIQATEAYSEFLSTSVESSNREKGAHR